MTQNGKSSMISDRSTGFALFSPKSMNIFDKSVGKIRWQLSLASRFCQLPTDFGHNVEQLQAIKPLASKKILAGLLANDFKDLGQKIARWQGYILKYIWSESINLTPIYLKKSLGGQA